MKGEEKDVYYRNEFADVGYIGVLAGQDLSATQFSQLILFGLSGR